MICFLLTRSGDLTRLYATLCELIKSFCGSAESIIKPFSEECSSTSAYLDR